LGSYPDEIGTKVRIPKIDKYGRKLAALFFMEYYFYILFSESANKYYTGFTSNLDGRIAAHNHPANKGWTRTYKPWKLVHSEVFITKNEAMERERQVKKLKSKDMIRKIIQNKTL